MWSVHGAARRRGRARPHPTSAWRAKQASGCSALAGRLPRPTGQAGTESSASGQAEGRHFMTGLAGEIQSSHRAL
jgi:hypothetical protein